MEIVPLDQRGKPYVGNAFINKYLGEASGTVLPVCPTPRCKRAAVTLSVTSECHRRLLGRTPSSLAPCGRSFPVIKTFPLEHACPSELSAPQTPAPHTPRAWLYSAVPSSLMGSV